MVACNDHSLVWSSLRLALLSWLLNGDMRGRVPVIVVQALVAVPVVPPRPTTTRLAKRIYPKVCASQRREDDKEGSNSCRYTDSTDVGDEKASRRQFLQMTLSILPMAVALSSGDVANAANVQALGSISTMPPACPKDPDMSDTLPDNSATLLPATIASSVTIAVTAASSTPVAVAAAVDWNTVLGQASKKALGGGRAGASASVVQVCTLMWLRTSMNYQYRYGGNLTSSLQTLWNEGGIARLYQGLPFALVQGPLTRFGDTAANIGIMALLQALPQTTEWPLPLKTACGSAAAGLWRILLMPIDASKTALQVEGASALERLWTSTLVSGPGVLYRGAFAQAAATAVGHFPWFLTYNYLDDILPLVVKGDDNAVLLGLARSAVLGFSASCVSDCASNSLRVIKTTKQTAQLSNDNSTQALDNRELSYPEVVKMIVEKDGLVGLFGRGLQTRLLTNAIQGAMFSILWKYFQQVNGVV
jgi:Mitochondrial carrier protein